MADNPDRNEPSRFGKRGRIVKQPVAERPASTQRPALVKWVIGAVAGLFLLSMLPFGGGGLLGGILGGLLAAKLFNKGTAQTTTARPAPTAPTAAASTPQGTIARGGFGATGAASAGTSVGG